MMELKYNNLTFCHQKCGVFFSIIFFSFIYSLDWGFNNKIAGDQSV